MEGKRAKVLPLGRKMASESLLMIPWRRKKPFGRCSRRRGSYAFLMQFSLPRKKEVVLNSLGGRRNFWTGGAQCFSSRGFKASVLGVIPEKVDEIFGVIGASSSASAEFGSLGCIRKGIPLCRFTGEPDAVPSDSRGKIK
jgi:hypothetical protein